MGESLSTSADGTLYWVPQGELTRLRKLQIDTSSRLSLLGDACRINALYVISRGGKLPLPGCFSRLETILWLYENELGREHGGRDLYVSASRDDAAALYSVLIALERVPFSELHRLRQMDGSPTRTDLETVGVSVSGSSLAMAISKAKGNVLANRLRNVSRSAFVLMGEAEAKEGQLWESLASAVSLRLHEVVTILQLDASESDASARSQDLLGRFRAFGWHGEELAGGDLPELASVLERIRGVTLPKVIALGAWDPLRSAADIGHAAAPTAAAPYAELTQALLLRLNRRCDELAVQRVALDSLRTPRRSNTARLQRLTDTYAEALAQEMGERSELILLDAALAAEVPGAVQDSLPRRFIACPAAETDMVSMASALAMAGFVPVCSASAFLLSARASEQIHSNAADHLRILYVAANAGMFSASPGQVLPSLRDLSAISTVPELVAIAPACESEVREALRWCLREHRFGSWLRLESVPWPVPFELPKDYRLEPGVGVMLRPGTDALLIGYGPVLLSEAFLAAERLGESGLSVAVLNLPWLNRVHAPWLSHVLSGYPHVFALDNHHVIGGQGDRIAEIMARAGFARWPRLHRCAIESAPAGGDPAQVLHELGLDAASLHDRVLAAVRTGRPAR
jgi:transketolase